MPSAWRTLIMKRTIETFALGCLLFLTCGGGLTALAQDSATPTAFSLPALPTSWGEVAGQTAHINGVDIYYEIYGEGDPVVMLHGGLSNGTYFANQIPELARHHKLIVMDSRGHGRSTFDDQPITYE